MAERVSISRELPAEKSSLSERVKALRLPDEEQMRSRSIAGRIGWGIAIVALVALGMPLLAMGWSRLSGAWAQANQAAPKTEAPPASAATKTETKPTTTSSGGSAIASTSSIPVASSGDVALEAKGYVIPAHQILVSPLVNGRILSLNLEEGRRVKKGDILAQLESIEYEADVARAKAILAASRSRLEEQEKGNRPEEIEAMRHELDEAKAQRAQLYTDWKRKSSLREKNVLTANEYELAESQFKAMDERVGKLLNNYKLMVEGPRKERIDMTRAEIAQGEAELKRAEWRLANCTIRAPISGTILKKNAEEGNIVNPIAFNGSFSLCEMADLSDLEVDLSIQERDISRVQQGQRCKVRSEAYPDRVYDGVVSRLMPIADRAKGAVPVRVKLTVPAEEEGVYLKPEMGAIVSFLKSKT